MFEMSEKLFALIFDWSNISSTSDLLGGEEINVALR